MNFFMISSAPCSDLRVELTSISRIAESNKVNRDLKEAYLMAALRDWLKRPERPDSPRPPEISWSPLIPLRAFADRAREIVGTKDEFEASWQAAGEHPDVLEAAA